MTNRVLVCGVIAAAGMASAACAGVDTLVATFNGVEPGANVQYTINSGDDWSETRGGLFNWTRNGGTYQTRTQFMTFCIELQENIGNGNQYEYEIIDLEGAPDSRDGMGERRANLIRELFARHYTPAFQSPLAQNAAVAMQIAIWEIVHERSANPLDISSGRARFDTGSGEARKLAEDYLKSLTGDGPRDYTLVAMTNASHQDQIIPTPGTLALAGLGLIASKRRRR